MPEVSPVVWSKGAVRAVIALCAFTLLATAFAAGSAPVAAADLTSQITATRSGQNSAESAMRTQDQRLTAIKRQRKAARKALKQAQVSLKKNKKALSFVVGLVGSRRARLVRAEAALAAALVPKDDPPADPSTDPPIDVVKEVSQGPAIAPLRARVKEVRKQVRIVKRRLADKRKRVRIATRTVKAKKARLRSLKRERRVAISRRESAEDVLAARIIGMTQLAAARAENQASVSYASQTAFSWPSLGRISQTYGCTGFRYNPRRGSCRHFHDGLDIVSAHGSAVRSVGMGVVAYAGWNPWDEGSRAWIIVVVHPDGWVSRYGHLIPTNHVRAGSLVYTGGVIGKMGNTGRSTGTHLHFELLRGGKDVNPLSYLPAGVVKIKIDKTSTRAGKQVAVAKAKKKARAKAARAKAKAARARKQAQAEAEAVELAAITSEACEPGLDLPANADYAPSFTFGADPALTDQCPAADEPPERASSADVAAPVAPRSRQRTTPVVKVDSTDRRNPTEDRGLLERGASPIPV